ncbi:MAG: pilus assembly protein PilM [Fibrobacteres bacterium]|nr:pilus assembly protein PilM [Fibrobacterota bacterium]
MTKRTIQAAKPGKILGIEHDHLGIRCARLSSDGRGSFTVDRLEEIKGDFAEDAALLEGLRQVRSIFGVSSRDAVVTCLAGKQIFASQIEFRRLSPEEMDQALRLELRKTVHFEVATSTLDYQILPGEDESSGGPVQVMVALAANTLLNRSLQLLERAGLQPSAVDVLPVAIANALWSLADGTADHPLIGLHVGAQISTIVIVSEHSPFFNRTIYFAAEDMFRKEANPADRDKRLQSLSDEVSRSLLFYEKNYGLSGYQGIFLLGDYLDGNGLIASLNRQTSLPIHKMDLPAKLGYQKGQNPGHFDLAVSLALRGDT